MAEQQFHELTVAAVRPQTAHAKAIRFDLPDALKAEFTFKPGQYLTLRTKLNGEEVRRSYSICCAPGEGLEIGVKHVEGGAFSSRMEAKDGSMGFDFAGTYTKIVPHTLIEYSFGDRAAQVEAERSWRQLRVTKDGLAGVANARSANELKFSASGADARSVALTW